MLLKRKYDKPDGWEPEYEGMAEFQAMLTASGMSEVQQAEMLAAFRRTASVVNTPPVVGVSVKHTGTHPEQHFKRQRVEEALAAGWMSIGQGKLTVHAEEEDLVFTITRIPGTYCCYCGAKLQDDVRGDDGRRHVALHHAGAESPDSSNPAGFLVTHAYECVLDESQHATWNGTAVAQRATQGGMGTNSANGTNGTGPHPLKRKRKSADDDEGAEG